MKKILGLIRTIGRRETKILGIEAVEMVLLILFREVFL